MTNGKLNAFAAVTLAILALPFLVACGDGDSRLSRTDVEEMVRAELADAPTVTPAEPGITAAEVEWIARGVVASIPPSSAPPTTQDSSSTTPSAGTRPRASTPPSPYYSREESVDAQWYVFIATPDGEVLGHYNAEAFAVHLEEMLDDGSFRAIAEGIWVTHEDVNPATGEVRDKHFWLVEHDGLVFGSGRHHDESGG